MKKILLHGFYGVGIGVAMALSFACLDLMAHPYTAQQWNHLREPLGSGRNYFYVTSVVLIGLGALVGGVAGLFYGEWKVNKEAAAEAPEPKTDERNVWPPPPSR